MKQLLYFGIAVFVIALYGCNYQGVYFLYSTINPPNRERISVQSSTEIRESTLTIRIISPTLPPGKKLTTTVTAPAIDPFTSSPSLTIFSASTNVTQIYTPIPIRTSTSTLSHTYISSHTITVNPSSPSTTPYVTLSHTPYPTNSSAPTATYIPTITLTLVNTNMPTSSSTPSPIATVTPLPFIPTRTVTNSPRPSDTTGSCIPVYNDGYESQLVALINSERTDQGLPSLAMNGALGSAARDHSTDMAINNFFSHTGSNGSTFWDRIISSGYSPSSGSENIAAGQGTPADVVASWMSSAGHKANILGAYTDIGAGYAYCATSSYGSYWTVDFGNT
jgi:uncharacterized protein YkwD